MTLLLLLGGAGSGGGGGTPTTAIVELAFGEQPLVDPAVASWTDVTAYTVGDVSIRRGRQTEMDTFNAGTCSVVLDNHDRRFDPEHTAGPYYGDLVPNVPMRVTITHGSTSRVRFYGFVNGWPQSYGPPADAKVTVTATDAFKLFARTNLPESVYAYEVAQDTPKGWWRLNDVSSGVASDASGNKYDGHYYEAQQGQSLIAGSSDGAVSGTFGTPGGTRVAIPALSGVTGLPVAFECWFEITDAAANGSYQLAVAQVTSGSGFELHIAWDGSVVVNSNFPSGQAVYYLTGFAATQGQPIAGIYHLVWRRTAAPANQIYLNGKLWATDTTGGSLLTGGNELVIGAYPAQWGSYSAQPYNGTIDEVAGYDTDLSSSRIAAHYLAGTLPWINDNTGTRLGRILDIIGWPAAQRDIDTGEVILDLATLGGRSILDYAQTLERTEQGRMFITRDGKVAFDSRDHDFTDSTASTSQATFTDAGTNVEYEPDLSVTLDDRFIVNEASVSRDGGGTVVVRDQTSIDTYGLQTKSVSGLLVRTDAETRNIAEGLVYRYKTPQPRIENWSVRPLNSTDWTTLLELDIGYRVTHAIKPQNTGSRVTRDMHIESITESYPAGTLKDATWTFTGSPVDSSSYFVWGTSTWGGTDVWR